MERETENDVARGYLENPNNKNNIGGLIDGSTITSEEVEQVGQKQV